MNMHAEKNAIPTGCRMSALKEGEADLDLESKANPSLNIVDEKWQGELVQTLSKLYKWVQLNTSLCVFRKLIWKDHQVCGSSTEMLG